MRLFNLSVPGIHSKEPVDANQIYFNCTQGQLFELSANVWIKRVSDDHTYIIEKISSEHFKCEEIKRIYQTASFWLMRNISCPGYIREKIDTKEEKIEAVTQSIKKIIQNRLEVSQVKRAAIALGQGMRSPRAQSFFENLPTPLAGEICALSIPANSLKYDESVKIAEDCIEQMLSSSMK